jgi:hypothetical protein
MSLTVSGGRSGGATCMRPLQMVRCTAACIVRRNVGTAPRVAKPSREYSGTLRISFEGSKVQPGAIADGAKVTTLDGNSTSVTVAEVECPVRIDPFLPAYSGPIPPRVGAENEVC